MRQEWTRDRSVRVIRVVSGKDPLSTHNLRSRLPSPNDLCLSDHRVQGRGSVHVRRGGVVTVTSVSTQNVSPDTGVP